MDPRRRVHPKLGRMTNGGIGEKEKSTLARRECHFQKRKQNSIKPKNLGRACGMGKGAGAQTWAVVLGLDKGCRNPSSANPEIQRQNCVGY